MAEKDPDFFSHKLPTASQVLFFYPPKIIILLFV